MKDLNLEVSFHGPFVYELELNKLTVTAPRCPGHLASVYTDEDEKALHGCDPGTKTSHLYELRPLESDSNRKPQCSSSFPNASEVIIVESQRCPVRPSKTDFYFKVELPCPDGIVGLISDWITYVEHDLPHPSPTTAKKATAMRFYYAIDPEDTFELMHNHSKNPIIRAKINSDLPQSHVPITFRYTSNGIFDPDHQDAEECFMRMRALFPPLGAWAASFDVDDGPHVLKAGGDCKASAIMIAGQTEKERWLSNNKSK